jgi:thiamine-monophosphate kinase
VGIGDDAALFKSLANANIAVTSDLLIEEVDFRIETTHPHLLGHKALAVSLSDIAAMGARPRWSLLSIGVPEKIWQSSFLERFYQGVFALAEPYGVKLIGGDISRAPDKVVIDSIVIGESHGNAVLRSGARVGDQIYVTGFLGCAAAGLRLLERGARVSETTDETRRGIEHILLRQLRPDPRVRWGILLGEQDLATSMIDLSDGLSSDLNHLCVASKVGALIDASLIPIDPLVTDLAGRRALDPLMLALHGGEDYELLFTVKSEDVSRLPKRVDGISLTRIGEIRDASEGVCIEERGRTWTLEAEGWKHF